MFKWWGWFVHNWPWTFPLAWLFGYELYAGILQLLKKLGKHVPKVPTLSQLVWRARNGFPALPWIVIPIVGILLAHFFFGLWAPPARPAATIDPALHVLDDEPIRIERLPPLEPACLDAE